jgi:hypothetical protein
MLQLLIDGLQAKGLYLTNNLNELEASCCASSTLVLDFDAVKDAYYRQIGFRGPHSKSCDVLLILPEENRIVFGEMKQMNLLIERFISVELASSTIEPDAIVEHVSDKIRNKQRPDQKMIDSLLLLLDIARYCEVDAAFFPFVFGENCVIECYFVMGFDSYEQFLLLENLLHAQEKYYRYHKIGAISFLDSEVFDLIVE